MKFTSVAIATVLTVSIVGCASNPTQTGSTSTPIATTPTIVATAKPVKQIKFSIAPEGKQSVADNDSFVLADLEKVVNTDLASKSLLMATSSDTVDVQITKVKVKHGASSYFAGPFAGADEITAKVIINGATAKAQVISATFTSMGGIFGTNKTESRLAEMHKEFAEKLVQALAR
jgi:uncharacterized protein YfdQ (DUF2303 family)